MVTKQRYLVTYDSNDPYKPKKITFGVYAKKHNQALSTVGNYIYMNDLHDARSGIEYKLTGKPSNAPADYEISTEEEGTIIVDDDRYSMD